MSTSPSRPRLAALDGLRLVAALAVLAFHYVGVKVPYWGVPSSVEFPGLNEVARYGYLGVNVFFAISGFVILMTAYDRSIESFAASRVARLFPAYWAVVVMTAVLQQFWTEGRNPSFSDALVNLTMTQEAYDVVNVQGAFWTLWIELKFYLLIGTFILVGMTRRRVLAFAVLWPLLGQIAAVTGSGFLNSLLIPTYAPYFAAGMLLYLLFRERHDVTTWLALLLNWVLCVRQAMAYGDRASDLVGAPVVPLVSALVVTGGLLAILVCSVGVVSRISWRWLTFAGALTYPLYLVHGQLGFFLIDTLQPDMGSYAVLAIATAASLVLAYLVHVVVEKPLSPRLRRAVAASLEQESSPR
ncbi:Peptidoglycan/LPS O-acetylase OafA/YrhL, contains acyltransferase and SGNH-hydrolase domains [Nocardioides scoriae]|uniref:Peptidoglycan/LPS O-acetylase OafA/YrhL, contains acyltransferase and SGNH-hydrolase domains n=1 Tax=Nocardioides scoriae TaxID=642780 RepID=A0A1H1TYY3_9ACTN|nr:acyltransferase [Nocardioides scoriae]SDS65447.1 Peptidoglycan/LPS O-acetylase OafA/YrhL, contains acyltransferase and SGNH-hydrolase domains [Nocardioides scoriae]